MRIFYDVDTNEVIGTSSAAIMMKIGNKDAGTIDIPGNEKDVLGGDPHNYFNIKDGVLKKKNHEDLARVKDMERINREEMAKMQMNRIKRTSELERLKTDKSLSDKEKIDKIIDLMTS